MSDVIEKARKLLALCTSPEEHEAKTAAWMLAKHLLKHELAFSVTPPSDPWGFRNSDGAREAEARRRTHERRRQEQERKKAEQSPPRTMCSRYRGVCKGCAEAIEEGDTIIWTPTEGEFPGAYHPGCYPGRT